MNGGSSIEAAANWVMTLASGQLAIMLAVLAIAGAGFAMLAGRIDVRRAAMAVFGCFLVFGARAIAVQLLGVANGGSTPTAAGSVVFRANIPPAPPPPVPSSPSSFDPYAGAALPEGY